MAKKDLQDSLGPKIQRMGTVLRRGAEREIGEYRRRFSSAARLYDGILSNMILDSFFTSTAHQTASEFFGTDEVRFAAVDGTSYSKSLFDLVIFFGGSYACTGTIRFTPEKVQVDYDERHIEDAKGLCSCVPMYVNEVADRDQTISGGHDASIAYDRLLTDVEIVTNSQVANGIMTFSEFFLAYRLASDPDSRIRIILMDRTLSGEISSLMYDTSDRKVWSRTCSILGYPINGTPIDENELFYSRHRVHNADLGTLPPRGDYLPYALIHHLEEGNRGDIDQISKALGLTASQKNRASRHLLRLKKQGMVGDILGNYRMAFRYGSYWPRVKAMVNEIGDRLFSQGEGATEGMVLEVEGRKRHLTTLDLAFLTLFAINMLIEVCWEKRILLLGLTKDTAARDFKRQVLPLLSNTGAFPRRFEKDEFEDIPNTDRMFLQAVSMMNSEKVKVPWALVEYDCAMRTVVHDPESGTKRVKGAIRNKIIPERLMLKSYVQLAQSENDPRFRSDVLLTDRLAYPGFDDGDGDLMEFLNDYHGSVEPVRPILHRDASSASQLQNVVVCMLLAMTSPSIPELFGHNKALYIADKVARWNNQCFRRMVETTSRWILTNRNVRDFVFHMSSFRERRSAFERSRKGS